MHSDATVTGNFQLCWRNLSIKVINDGVYTVHKYHTSLDWFRRLVVEQLSNIGVRVFQFKIKFYFNEPQCYIM